MAEGKRPVWSSASRVRPASGKSALIDGSTTSGCFAGHCDWRLPSIEELRSIVDLAAPGCGRGSACINQTVFGPTIAFFYWSATTDVAFPVFTWGVAFGVDGSVSGAIQDAVLFVRGVRSSL